MDKATAAYFRMNAAKQMKGKKNMSELGKVIISQRLLITNVGETNVGDSLFHKLLPKYLFDRFRHHDNEKEFQHWLRQN